MTQNQLKYWELRWKQHYENAQLTIERSKLELEIAKLNETIRHNVVVERETSRHNRVEERHETQRLIQEQQKIQQEWTKIGFNYQAKIIELGTNAAKVRSEWETKMKSLSIEEKKLAQKDIELAQQAETILDNKLVIVSDIITSLKENKDKDDRERMKILADAVGPIGKDLGLGMMAVVTAKVESMLKTSEYDAYLNYLQDNYPETFRLTEQSSGVGDSSANQTTSTGKIRYKDYQEMFGPAAPEQLDKDINKYLNINDPRVDEVPKASVAGHSSTEVDTPQPISSSNSGVTIGKSGSQFYSDHTKAGSTHKSIETKHGNTGVIYSPGSHYGPGYQ